MCRRSETLWKQDLTHCARRLRYVRFLSLGWQKQSIHCKMSTDCSSPFRSRGLVFPVIGSRQRGLTKKKSFSNNAMVWLIVRQPWKMGNKFLQGIPHSSSPCTSCAVAVIACSEGGLFLFRWCHLSDSFPKDPRGASRKSRNNKPAPIWNTLRLDRDITMFSASFPASILHRLSVPETVKCIRARELAASWMCQKWYCGIQGVSQSTPLSQRHP